MPGRGFSYVSAATVDTKDPKSRDPALKLRIKILHLQRRLEPKIRTTADDRFPLTFFMCKQ